MLQAWGVTDKGPVRPTNQDCFAIDEQLRLCVVADGMGGHNAGDVAARAAVDTVVTVVAESTRTPGVGWPYGFDSTLSEAGNVIRTAIHLANARILDIAGRTPAYAGMGTTIVAALEVNGRLSVGHVGDSRLYHFSSGRARQLTGDDSWMAAIMACDPRVDAAALRHHPLRHVLTNVVGTRREACVHVAEEPLQTGDKVLLTTDGVHGSLDGECLEHALAGGDDLSRAAADLVRAALAGGSRDNCTAVIARYLPDPPKSA